MDSASRSRLWTRVVLTALVVLVIYTFYLSLTRIYQVDEAQNVFMARVTALGRQKQYYTNGSLILLGPMAWIAGHAKTSEGMYTAARLVFFVLYWLNMAMIPLVAGLHIRSRAYVVALLFVALLPPLLDYGLEVRHDNVLLTLLLLSWAIPRCFKGPGWTAFLLLGALAGVMQFTAFKSFLYWMPLSAGILAFPPVSMKTSWLRRGIAWLAGLALAALLVRILYGTNGAWEAYVNGVHTAFGQSDGPIRFPPWDTIARLLDQTPLLLSAGVFVTYWSIQRVRTSGWKTLGWEGSGPEGLLFFLATLAFLINPVPYPYNLLHLVPFLILWVVRSISDPWVGPAPPSFDSDHLRPLWLGVILFCYVIPSVRFASRHLNWTNERQRLLMETAESLTDPSKDRVFDATGLVPTRESVGYQWFLHTLVMGRFRNGTLTPLWKQFEANPPEVVIRNYRTDWMGLDEQRFLEEHYLPLSDDFLVLGVLIPAEGGTFACLHSGRYQVSLINQQGTIPEAGIAWVDDQPFRSGSLLDLATGPHKIRTQEQFRTQVVWVGPGLSSPPRIPQRDHRLLFVNWY